MSKVNPKIIDKLLSPSGCYEKELASIDPNYEKQLEALKASGMEIVRAKSPEGKPFLFVTNADEIERPEKEEEAKPETPPAPPQTAIPPAEAPASEVSAEEEEMSEPGFDAFFKIDRFKVQSREGQQPTIQLVPAAQVDAKVALLFSMDRPKGSVVRVYLKIERPPEKKESETVDQEQTESPTEKGEDVVEPKDYATIQINTGHKKEKDPKKKPKQQLSSEIDEQVQKGEISPTTADAMAELGKL